MHIAAIAQKARNHKPRTVPPPKAKTILAGTQILEIDNETVLRGLLESRGTDIAWQKALDQGNYEEAVEIAREEAENLKILSIKADKAPEPLKTLENFICMATAFSDLATLPILIESCSWAVIEKGLKCFQGRGLVRYIGPSEEPREAPAANNEKIRSLGANVH
jgi:5-methyltetrahydrofolate--homocysteine methyltransferase